MQNNDLLEPAKLYEYELKEKHNENVEKFFDELVKKSNIDVEANRVTCKNIHKEEASLEKLKNSLDKANSLKGLFIAMIVLGIIAALISFFFRNFINGVFITLLVLGIASFIGGIILLVKVYKPRKNKLLNEISVVEEKIRNLIKEAEEQVASLNRLFESSMPAKLFNKTCPLIEMDRIFDVKKYQMMVDKYEMWGNEEEDSSTLDLQSGSILGNPFVFFKDLDVTQVTETYHGSRTISYSIGSGNNRRTITETLRASYQAPKPYYSTNTYLVYGNDAANRLSFSREPSNINSMNDEEIRKYVNKHEKDLDKIAAKQMKNGGNFTPIGNPEFELFFGGLDRDNEVEFRLLFTALGQKSMMDLLKSKVGYGDDFVFKKIKGLNIISSRHSQGSALFVDTNYFRSYEFDQIKEKFIIFNNSYFKAVFFDFAPLLSIPLYQQNKTHEYIYKGTVKSNFTPFSHEVVANKYHSSALADLKSKTDVILKSKLIKKTGETDVVHIDAHSFDAINRIAIVPVIAGNGRIYDVSVPWTEYIPLTRESVINISDTGVDDEIKFKELGNEDVIYAKGLVSNIDGLNVDIKKIKAQMKKS